MNICHDMKCYLCDLAKNRIQNHVMLQCVRYLPCLIAIVTIYKNVDIRMYRVPA